MNFDETSDSSDSPSSRASSGGLDDIELTQGDVEPSDAIGTSVLDGFQPEARPQTSANVTRFAASENEFINQRRRLDYDEGDIIPLDSADAEAEESTVDGDEDDALPPRPGAPMPGESDFADSSSDSLHKDDGGFPDADALMESHVHTAVYLHIEDDGATRGVLKTLAVPLPDVGDEATRAADVATARELMAVVAAEMAEVIENIAEHETPLSPPLVPVAEVQTDAALRFLTVTAHVKGGSVADLTAFALPGVHAVRCLFRAIMSAVCDLHTSGLAHGNLKATNILLSEDSGVLLTDGCGIMTSPVLSADFSFMSPRLAAHLESVVETPEDAEEPGQRYLFEAWCSYHRDPMTPNAQDDLYAIGQLVCEVLNGFSFLFAKPLAAALRELLHFKREPAILPHVARHRELDAADIACAASFVAACVSGGCTALDLLGHEFLRLDESPTDLAMAIADMAAEVRCRVEAIRRGVGSAPLNLRLMRNSLYARAHADAHGAALVEAVLPPLPTGCCLDADEGVLLITGSDIDLELTALPRCCQTVIIRHLRHSSVALLDGAVRLIVHDVESCAIALGPQLTAVLDGVHTSRIALISRHLFLNNVTDTELSFLGVEPPICPNPDSCANLRVLPFSVCYPGLSAQIDALHLPHESAGALLNYPDTERVLLHRTPIDLLRPQHVGHDYPFLHSLASAGVLHHHGGIPGAHDSDFCMYSGECTDFRIVIDGIHGSSGNPNVFPMIVIVDRIADVVISNCSDLTVVVAYAAHSVLLKEVERAKVYVAGSSAACVGCRALQLFGFSPEPLVCRESTNVDAFPWNLAMPQLEEVFGSDLLAAGHNAFVEPPEDADERDDDSIRRHKGVSDVAVLAVNGLGDVSMAVIENQAIVAREAPLRPFAPPGAPPVNTPSVLLHGLTEAALLRCRRALSPARLRAPAATASENDNGGNIASLHIVGLHTGVIHIADAVSKLTVSHCSGPLEVVVAAAESVRVVHCKNVTVHVACFEFVAEHSHGCHFALHVNSPPQLDDGCSEIGISTLNITTEDLEELLALACVRAEVNLFDKPIVAGDGASRRGGRRSRANSDAQLPTGEWPTRPYDFSRPYQILRPLPGSVIGSADDVPFCDFLEDKVTVEESRPDIRLAQYEAMLELRERVVRDSSELPSAIRDDSQPANGELSAEGAAILARLQRGARASVSAEENAEQDSAPVPPREARAAMGSMTVHESSSSSSSSSSSPRASEGSGSDEELEFPGLEVEAGSRIPVCSESPTRVEARTAAQHVDPSVTPPREVGPHTSRFDSSSSSSSSSSSRSSSSGGGGVGDRMEKDAVENAIGGIVSKVLHEGVAVAAAGLVSPTPRPAKDPAAQMRYDMGFGTDSDSDSDSGSAAPGADSLQPSPSREKASSTAAAAMGIDFRGSGGRSGLVSGMRAARTSASAVEGDQGGALFESRDPLSMLRGKAGDGQPESVRGSDAASAEELGAAAASSSSSSSSSEIDVALDAAAAAETGRSSPPARAVADIPRLNFGALPASTTTEFAETQPHATPQEPQKSGDMAPEEGRSSSSRSSSRSISRSISRSSSRSSSNNYDERPGEDLRAGSAAPQESRGERADDEHPTAVPQVPPAAAAAADDTPPHRVPAEAAAVSPKAPVHATAALPCLESLRFVDAETRAALLKQENELRDLRHQLTEAIELLLEHPGALPPQIVQLLSMRNEC